MAPILGACESHGTYSGPVNRIAPILVNRMAPILGAIERRRSHPDSSAKDGRPRRSIWSRSPTEAEGASY